MKVVHQVFVVYMRVVLRYCPWSSGCFVGMLVELKIFCKYVDVYKKQSFENKYNLSVSLFPPAWWTHEVRLRVYWLLNIQGHLLQGLKLSLVVLRQQGCCYEAGPWGQVNKYIKSLVLNSQCCTVLWGNEDSKSSPYLKNVDFGSDGCATYEWSVASVSLDVIALQHIKACKYNYLTRYRMKPWKEALTPNRMDGWMPHNWMEHYRVPLNCQCCRLQRKMYRYMLTSQWFEWKTPAVSQC